jgi:hypothetical protein
MKVLPLVMTRLTIQMATPLLLVLKRHSHNLIALGFGFPTKRALGLH